MDDEHVPNSSDTMDTLHTLPASIPGLYDVSDSIKVMEVAKKYDAPNGEPNVRVPEYTPPGGEHSYHCSKVAGAWTQGFFPGLLWLLVERRRLLPQAVEASYTEEQLIHYARRWQEGFKWMARPAQNHDQGFRFQLSYGYDYALTGDEEARKVVIDAAESLLERYDDKVGCIRSWDLMKRHGQPDVWRMDNRHEHYLVIIDNMMNLDILYEATELTGDKKYAAVATRQAEVSSTTHVRPDGTTYHVVDFNADGTVKAGFTHQGYEDESCWSRGQAWAIYGFAQCALRTRRKDFTDLTRKLVDKFIELLPESGVPWWDFDAPKPCPYDVSAATITACGMLMLYRLLKDSDAAAADGYLARAFKLIEDTLRECKTGQATIVDGKVNWGEGEWETILTRATINLNRYSPRPISDHGLVYADFYLEQFANEALKLRPAPN